MILTIPSTNTIDLEATLGPGTYHLLELTDVTIGGLVGFSPPPQELTLDASFTSIIPEPRWTLFGPLLLLALGRCIIRSEP